VKSTFGGALVPAWSNVRARYHGTELRRDLHPLRIGIRYRPPVTLRSQVATAISNPDFVAVTLFCVVGFLATLNLILRFPDSGAALA
jgi:hypothetical protein